MGNKVTSLWNAPNTYTATARNLTLLQVTKDYLMGLLWEGLLPKCNTLFLGSLDGVKSC